MRKARATMLLLTCGVSLPVGAQLLPVGTQFQVNDYSTGQQYHPAVSPLADGGFLVVWQSAGSGGGDAFEFSIQGRRFTAEGAPEAAQFQVNSYAAGNQIGPDVAPIADGSVVVWQGPENTQTSVAGILGQRFSEAGAPAGPELMVSDPFTLPQVRPAVAGLADGDFVVVWECFYGCWSDSSGIGILARRFAADGVPDGPSFQVNSYILDTQRSPDVAGLANGGFVVVWESSGSSGDDSSGYSIQGQLFAANGSPQGGQFEVNSYTTGSQSEPAVSGLDTGAFVVVWESDGSSGGDTDLASIQGQRFALDGAPVGDQFQVNSYTTASQGGPAVIGTGDGSFVVAWTSGGSYGSDSDYSIQARQFAANGTPEGAQFQVNSYTTSFQTDPALAGTPAGDLVVTWQSNGSSGSDTSGRSVQAQRYRRAIFADGFENGTTDAWSVAAP